MQVVYAKIASCQTSDTTNKWQAVHVDSLLKVLKDMFPSLPGGFLILVTGAKYKNNIQRP